MITGLVTYLLSLVSINSCDQACMASYYQANKDDLEQIFTHAFTGQNGLAAHSYSDEMQNVTIQETEVGLEVMFQYNGGIYSEGMSVTWYLNPDDLDVVYFKSSSSNCSSGVLSKFESRFEHYRFREVLELYQKIQPHGIQIIGERGIFISLGKPLQSPNPNLRGGILMALDDDFTSTHIVQTLAPNVYLYDDLFY